MGLTWDNLGLKVSGLETAKRRYCIPFSPYGNVQVDLRAFTDLDVEAGMKPGTYRAVGS